MRFFFLLLAVLFPALAHAAPQTATINGAQISYEVCGDESAPGLVLLHDGLVNSAVWDGVWPLLCEKYRAVRYDRRGYGKSPPATAQHSPADDLWGVMRHVGLEHAHLVAAAAGAGIAVDFLFDYPEGIDKMVLVAPALSGFRPTEAFLARLRALEEHIRADDLDATIAAIDADPHFMAPESTEARATLAAILKASPGDLGGHPLQMRPPGVALRLGEIYAPTLIVVGALDHPYNNAVATAMQQRMRAAKLDVVLETGHLLYLERPRAFADLVTAFLN